ncbi:putative methyltransferase, partial [Mycobacterium rhizamassiliense]
VFQLSLSRKIINKDKVGMIDKAFPSLGIESFADLGGVWRVEGAYTFHALDKHGVKNAALVDLHLTPTVVDRAKSHPQLRLINGNFGSQAIADEVGEVDAVFLFDVLLHQVGPDWGTILKMYAKNVRHLLIYNQQWTGSDKTVRLLDLGEKEYFRNVPHSRRVEEYKNLFEKLDQKHPEFDGPWRDFPGIWQWGITDADLESKVAELGFKLVSKKECGKTGMLPNFRDRAFIFSRQ